ncbi:hypothetical protein [Eikenella sp. Marseille-P7795]|uniref:hypothetical protein n=1 Tax=Eikenella sp. Marseille-P7795 TaxID=2866577 RepID=UPI001CE3FD3D|nr:hypothetical protein [Eikenella sp. Marseille-P7795]
MSEATNPPPTPPRQPSGKLKGYLKKYAPLLKKLAILGVVSCLLVSCDFSRSLILQFLPTPAYQDFPLGQHKRLEFNETIYLKHRYCLWTKIEFIDGMINLWGPDADKGVFGPLNEEAQKMQQAFTGLGDLSEESEPMYTIRMRVYRKGLRQETLMFQKEYTNFVIEDSYGANTDNPRNIANNIARGCFELPIGRYRFELTDQSPFRPEFNQVQTSVVISPVLNFK